MKRRQRKNSSTRERKKLKLSSLQRPIKPMLTQISIIHPQQHQSNLLRNDASRINDDDSSRSQNISEFNFCHQSSKVDSDVADVGCSEILSQDFFCTPDYITPECQNLFSDLDGNKENIACPPSPEKLKTVNSKIIKRGIFVKSPGPLSDHQRNSELSTDVLYEDENNQDDCIANVACKGPSYVPQSAIALRCRVMPPPCLKNPYIKDAVEMDVDPFGSWRTKCSGYLSSSTGVDSMSRYRSDFQEIEQIGNGNFSRVFKVLKRIDGCMYAVKHSTRQLCLETERRKALMEVQALAAIGFHENIVAYHTSWFENEQLYIQMELCDYSLSVYNSSCSLTEEEILEAFLQIARALQYIHVKGIAHLDVKPENIYVKNGVYKLGDFGGATLLDQTLPIEEGDARYMPQEILNEKYDHLDKVDIFSLGVSIYELLRGSSLPDAGYQLLKVGKLPLLPSHSLQLQNLLKVMVDPDPTRRPSAKELVQNPIFSRIL
ncbi:wee1-like protein kinase isoform X2 [Amaranthus tricolor]|uniref:wee1-like protein kinase isoform X2 n=1 Tax=Amaranthus tricolor TaxID=29722 RepID=UPI00258D701D|nr:wee1-like protein kinase isoform X2 [Amaranthus tricolor]